MGNIVDAIRAGSCIERCMQVLRVDACLLLILLAAAISGHGAAVGSFRGKIVADPAARPGWLFVAAPNGSIRRARISSAHVAYDRRVPPSLRRARPRDALVEGAEVRVTAEQGRDGEWQASRVDILTTARRSMAAATSDHDRPHQ